MSDRALHGTLPQMPMYHTPLQLSPPSVCDVRLTSDVGSRIASVLDLRVRRRCEGTKWCKLVGVVLK